MQASEWHTQFVTYFQQAAGTARCRCHRQVRDHCTLRPGAHPEHGTCRAAAHFRRFPYDSVSHPIPVLTSTVDTLCYRVQDCDLSGIHGVLTMSILQGMKDKKFTGVHLQT